MAGLIDPNDIAKARQSGYSDQEITTFLADKHPEQFKAAKEAGYSDKEVLEHLAPTPQAPSGVIAGLQHGVAEAVRGDASTIGLTGASTPTMDAAANVADPKNYKSASLIKDGGHWYNPSDYQPSAIPQLLAEQAPGLAQDASVGYAAGKLAPGGAAIKAMAGMGGFAGSALLRTFGPGAHANADARTGVPNSPVATQDLTREAAKQAIEAPLNMIPGGRLLGPAEKKLASSALAKIAESTGAGAANNLVDQVGTTAGSKDGINVDGNSLATAALTRAAGHALLVAPRAGADAINDRANGRFEVDPETKSAATDVANRFKAAADGTSMVGPLGGTKKAEAVKDAVHGDIHRELSDAAQNEQDLSTGPKNTLARIQEGGTATPSELTALAAEADPETTRLARQAVISGQVKATGGISAAMEKLSLINNPVKSAVGAGLIGAGVHAGIGAGLATVAPAALAGVFGTYGAARALDKMSGQRSPIQGFTDRFADDSPVRAAPTTPPVDPFNPSAGPWGARGEPGMPVVAPPQDAPAPQPSLRNTLNANAKIDEGMAKIAKQIAAQKKQSMIAGALPALQALAASRQPPAPVTTDVPAQPVISPIALKMLNQKLKQGLPEEAPPVAPVPTVAPPAAPEVNPLMLPRNITAPARNIMAGARTVSKAQNVYNIATQKADGIAQADGLAADSHTINDQGGISALSNPAFTRRGSQLLSAANVMRKLTAQPEEASSPGVVSDAPASPAISSLMQKLQGQPGVPAPAAAPTQAPPPVSSMADILQRAQAPAEAPPAPPVIAKITKKMGKPMEETPHQSDYAPMDPEQLWGRGMGDKEFAQAEASTKSDIKYPERYMDGIVRDRVKRRGVTVDLLGDNPNESDQTHAADLLEELHHTTRADKAAGAITHFSAKMSPHARAAFRKRMDKSFINSMWSK